MPTAAELTIVRMTELNEEQLAHTFDLFAEGFYFIFSMISKDKAKLRDLFMDAFDREMAIVCLEGDTPVGMLACGNCQKQPIAMRKETCAALLGRFKGGLVYAFAGPMLGKPKVTDPAEGYLDYLTTDPACRGRGIGTKLLQNGSGGAFPYGRYSFEVLSKNENAIRLYKKLGYTVEKVKNDPFAMLVGSGRPVIFRVK